MYTIKKSLKASHLRITIKADGTVVVTLPYRMDERKAEKFIEEKKEWIQKSVQKMKIRFEENGIKQRMSPKGTKKEFGEYKNQALVLVLSRLDYFNVIYGYTWKNVNIKNVSTRWGSCSKRGDLNFSYKIALLPLHLADYIIVHELCHLGAFNHSQKFWNLVARTIPNYKTLRKELRGVI